MMERVVLLAEGGSGFSRNGSGGRLVTVKSEITILRFGSVVNSVVTPFILGLILQLASTSGPGRKHGSRISSRTNHCIQNIRGHL